MKYASLFVSHGAPTLPLEDSPARHFLERLGRELPPPRAVVAVSPHWGAQGFAVKAPPRFATWHDFGGFPDELYRLRYAPAGDAALARRVRAQMQAAGFAAAGDPDARLDHGVWVPLMLMFPRADIPLVQIAGSAAPPRRYRELGRALAPLAEDGVLLLGTGGLVHNLGEVEFGATGAPDWARAFDEWTHARLVAGDWDALDDYRQRAPHAARAHPGEDHFLPLFFAGGAGGAATALHRSFSHGSLSMAVYGFR